MAARFMLRSRPMRRHRWASAAILLALVACGDPTSPGSADAGPPPPDPRFETIAEAVRADLNRPETLATAASVAVWLDGEVRFVGGFGSLEPDGRVPGEDTLFMIGSDTKKLTAISLLRRVEAGQATLETTVASVVPDLSMTYATDFPGATIRDLLSHQGGIVDDAEDGTTTTDEAFETYVLGQFATHYYPLAPPGRIWNYSNPNFSIAGFLDQRLDGRMWPDIVTEDLFAPLHMQRSVARKSAVDADYAPGVGPDGPVDLPGLWESAFVRPAGLVWSTASDQMRVARFLVDGDPNVLSPDLLAEVSAEQVPVYPDLPGAYGFGLFVDRGLSLGSADYYDVPVWSHGGNTLTHTSTFYILPEQRFAISILSNGNADDFTGSVVTAIRTLVTLPAETRPPDAPFDPAGLDALVGSYRDDYNVGELIITRVGDVLQLSAPALDELQIAYDRDLSPITTRVWMAMIDGYPLDLAFIDGPEGETYLRNRIFVAIRAPSTKPAPGARHPDREALRRLFAAGRVDPLRPWAPPRPEGP